LISNGGVEGRGLIFTVPSVTVPAKIEITLPVQSVQVALNELFGAPTHVFTPCPIRVVSVLTSDIAPLARTEPGITTAIVTRVSVVCISAAPCAKDGDREALNDAEGDIDGLVEKVGDAGGDPDSDSRVAQDALRISAAESRRRLTCATLLAPDQEEDCCTAAEAAPKRVPEESCEDSELMDSLDLKTRTDDKVADEGGTMTSETGAAALISVSVMPTTAFKSVEPSLVDVSVARASPVMTT
jgi:hypothetical protein